MFSNILALSFLYFVQGIPYGFQARFLPLYLRSRGTSLTDIGLLKLVLTPWLLKALWAPLVDKFGTKKDWLIGSMLGLTVICLCTSTISSESFHLLYVLMIAMNICAATQDVAVDSIAIQILNSDELAHGNTAQVVGYKFGAICGGGILVWLSDVLDWTGLFYVLAAIYAAAVVGTSSSSKLSGFSQRNLNHENEGVVEGFVWRKILAVPGTVWMLGFVLMYKLGETGALNMLPLFLLEKGYPTTQLGFWVGVVGDIVSIAGSVLGGQMIYWYRPPLHDILKVLCLLRLVAIATLLSIVSVWSLSSRQEMLYIFSIAIMLSLLLLSGVTTTVTFTLMMQCSQRAPHSIQATHYTALATVEVFGKLLFSSAAVVIADYFGFCFVYSLFVVLSVLLLVHLFRYENSMDLVEAREIKER